MTPITDHVDQALNRLITQYKANCANLQNTISGFVEQTQDDENMFQEFFAERYLATAIGAQLDGLGQIIGVNRGSLNDADYRARLYLKIAQNFSEGAIENLIWIYKELMDADSIILSEIFPAEFSMMAINPNPITDLTTVYNSIILAKAAGIGISFLGYTNGEPFFAFLDDPGLLNDTFGNIFDLDIGGIFVSTILNPPIVSPDLGVLYREKFDYPIGTDMLTKGYSWTQYLTEVGTFLTNASEQGEIKTTVANWAGGFTYDVGEIWTDYDFYIDLVSYGSRFIFGVRFTNVGGYWIQWLPSSQLRIFRGPKNFPNGITLIGTYDSVAPATVSCWKVSVVGNSIKVYADNVFLFEHFDAVFSVGTFGLSNYQSPPSVVDNILVIDRS